MGVLFQVVLTGIFVGSLAAIPFVLYRRLALPALERAGARPGAYLVAAVPAVTSLGVAVAFVVGWAFGAPMIDVLWLIGTAMITSVLTEWIVRPATRLTGGPSEDRSPRDVELEARLAAAERHFQRMDLDRYVAELEATAGTWAPGSVEVHDTSVACWTRTAGASLPPCWPSGTATCSGRHDRTGDHRRGSAAL